MNLVLVYIEFEFIFTPIFIIQLHYLIPFTGILDVCKHTKTPLINFEKSGVCKREIRGRTYHIAKPVMDCDVIINLPKIKTHSLMTFTCAVKNMYGVVPGLRKTEYHKMAPKPSEFAEIVVDIFSLAKPQLNIVDGIIGMDGTGPSARSPKKIGAILASDDSVAVDSLISHLLGKDPMKVPSNRIASHQGIGEGILRNIQVIGEFPVINNFRWPQNFAGIMEMIPSSIAQGLMRLWWSRPAIDPNLCTNCNTCVKSCPVGALIKGNPVPKFEQEKCINCLCCMEMCPQKAVFEDKNRLYKFISKFTSKN